MAAPSYTTDLVDWIAHADTAAWGELTGAIAGGAPDEVDTESALQGTNAVSQATNTTSLFSMCRILAGSVTLATNNVFLVWHGHGVATSLLSYASGGLRIAVATTLADWKAWAVGGNDVPPFPYGKWVNNPVDPTIAGEYTNGTPPAALTFFGVGSMGQLGAAIAKGQPHVVDIIRYGRAEARINGGETDNFAVFSGFAAANDATSTRWGLIQATDGGYLWKGLMTLGYTSAVDFRDSNKTIFIQDTRKVYSSFNKVEIRQASSRVDWTGITFTCLSPSTTASKGALEMIDAADVNIESCNFIDMDTFIFLSTATINGSVFRRTGQITTGGATLTGCAIDRNTASSAVLASSPANAALISATDFTSDGTGHGLEITGTTADMTLTDDTWSGYAADGDTGDEAVYVNTTGGTGVMNLTISGGTTPSIRKGAGVTTVNVISGAVNVTVKTTTTAGANVQNVRVLVVAAAGGPFPFNVTVTIARSDATTAVVTHTDHGMATNDKVQIKGADQVDYNGVFTITKIDNDSYSYQVANTPATPATGTPIKATFAVLSGLIDTNGEITMSRVFPSAQPITGKARKSSASPRYKTAGMSGTVSTSDDLSTTLQMILDE